MKLPNGYGSVTKLKGRRRKPWRVMLPCQYIEGKESRKMLGCFATKKEAMFALASHQNKPDIITEAPTFEFCYNGWFSKWKLDKNEGTIANNTSLFKSLSDLHNIPITDFKIQLLQDFYDKSDFSPTKKKNTRNLLNMVINYAVINDYCDKNYLKGVNIGKVETKIERKPYTTEEIKELWKDPENIFNKVTLIQLYTGMRVGEVFDLKKENIHLDERYMIGGLKTKAGRNRVIPIHKDILPLIENLNIEITLENFKVQYRATNRNHTTHEARVTFISRMSELDVDLLAVKKIVGHASGNITEDLYTKKSIKKLVETVDKLYYM